MPPPGTYAVSFGDVPRHPTPPGTRVVVRDRQPSHATGSYAADEFPWTRQFGGSFDDGALELAADPSGLYVVGLLTDVAPDGTAVRGTDAFIRKLDAADETPWADTFGTPEDDVAFAVDVREGDAFVGGRTWGEFPGQTRGGFRDEFLRRYDTGGNEVWTRQFGTIGDNAAFAVRADATGLYVAGSEGIAQPGQESGPNAFVARLDLDGNPIWKDVFGSGVSNAAVDLAVDPTGVYAVGSYRTSIIGGSTAFVRKYAHDGANVLWEPRFGGVYGVAVASGPRRRRLRRRVDVGRARGPAGRGKRRRVPPPLRRRRRGGLDPPDRDGRRRRRNRRVRPRDRGDRGRRDDRCARGSDEDRLRRRLRPDVRHRGDRAGDPPVWRRLAS
ncbi:MAG: hypothetical protein ACT4OI_04350 [Methanobacteriota archaeon]